MAIDIGGLLSGGGLAASAYLPYEAAAGNIDFLKERGPQLAQQATQIGQQAAEAAEFQPFAVTTGTGTTTIGEGGALTQQLGQTPAQIQQSLLQQVQAGAAPMAMPQQFGGIQQSALEQAQATLGQATPTAQSLFQQMQATLTPEQERQRIALENRLAAQGRLGTQTAMYGGTPESLALEKAIQEQTAQNLLSATQLAPQLAQQQTAQAAGLFGLGQQAGLAPLQQQAAQLQNVGSALGTAYVPQTQELAALQQAANLSQIAQTGRLGASEALYQGGIGGLEAQAAADTGVAALESARVNALANALSGMFSGQAGFNPETGSVEVAPSAFESWLKSLGV